MRHSLHLGLPTSRLRASLGATTTGGAVAPTTGVDHSTVAGAWVILGVALVGAAVSVALANAK